jgi:hypothetical protein
MNPHIGDDLPRLLTGEATRDEVLIAAEHLRTCVDCQQELVSDVVAHASLTSAQRFAPELVSRPIDPDAPRSASDASSPVALPDLSAVFAQVRAEAEASAPVVPVVAAAPVVASRRPGRVRYLLGAAAAVVLLGAGAGIYAGLSGNDHSSNNHVAVGNVVLHPYGASKVSATAAISGTAVSIDASKLPQLADKQYEVWLTNSDRTRMQPVGWLGADGTAAMTIPSALLSQFQDIEVSVQPVNSADYAYSGTSVLRGAIA